MMRFTIGVLWYFVIAVTVWDIQITDSAPRAVIYDGLCQDCALVCGQERMESFGLFYLKRQIFQLIVTYFNVN